MNTSSTPRVLSSLNSLARALVQPGKGILAADESFPTLGRRFAALHVPFTAENRLAYRELLLTTGGLGDYISGAILFEETLNQTLADGSHLSASLVGHGIVPGIKVDTGVRALPAFPEEKTTRGLDSLRARLAAYDAAGARFTKWRATFLIGGECPTSTAIETNARLLALFAATSQEAGLVPIVEPEVLMAGNHSLARCAEVTHLVLRTVFARLAEHRVALDGMLLKTGMILPGDTGDEVATSAKIAQTTLHVLRAEVPPAVPGIVFLSGGQSDIAATDRLNAICQSGDQPWNLSFSFGRALQDAAMKTWSGDPARAATAQAALLKRARLNSLAVQGKYHPEAEDTGA